MSRTVGTHIRHLSVVAPLALVLASSAACVSPEEFERADNGCGEGSFDAPGRDRYCSGEVKMLALEAPELVPGGEGPVFVQLADAGMTVSRLDREANRLRINVFGLRGVARRDALPEGAGAVVGEDSAEPSSGMGVASRGLTFNERYDLDGAGSARVTNGARAELALDVVEVSGVKGVRVLGVDRSNIEQLRLTAAVAWGEGRLSFIDLASTEAAAESERPRESVDTYTRQGGSVRAEGWSSVPCEAEGGFEFGEMVPFKTLNDRGWYRRYMAAATPCGLMVFGKGPHSDHQATIVAQLPVDVGDIKFDVVQKRMFMASGRQGLRVSYTTTLEQQIDSLYDELWPPQRYIPVAARADENAGDFNENSGNNGAGAACDPEAETGCESLAPNGCPPDEPNCDQETDNDGDPTLTGEGAEAEPPVPLFESAGFDEVVDASQQDGVNVTHVDFSAERVFFVNDDSASSGRTTVVSGRLTPANTLDTRQSVEVEGLDLELEFARFALAPLNGSLFALVRQGWDGEAMRLRVDVYDAPEGHDPALVTTLPLRDDAVAAVADGDGGVMVIYEDSVEIFTLSAEGDPR